MITATYKTGSGRIELAMEGEDIKSLFATIGSVAEVFEAGAECGMCGSTDTRPLVRVVDDYTYYEFVCKCRAKLAFGQAKKGGGLFPRRKDAQDNWLPNNGWSKYGEDSTPQAPVPAQNRPHVSEAPKPAASAQNGSQRGYGDTAQATAADNKAPDPRKRFFARWKELGLPQDDQYSRFVIRQILHTKGKLQEGQTISSREEVEGWQWALVADDIGNYKAWLDMNAFEPMSENGFEDFKFSQEVKEVLA